MSGTTPTTSGAPDIATGVLRAVLAGGGGWLVNHGLATSTQASTLEGALVVVATAAWSIYANWKQQKKLVAAVAAPAGKAS